MRTKLNQFEEDFAVTALAIDALWGGKYPDPDGDHLIVDGYCSGMEQPSIEPTDLWQFFRKEGVKVNDPDLVDTLIQQNCLSERLGRLTDYTVAVEDPWRREFLEHTLSVLETILTMRKSMVDLADDVSDEQVYRTAFGIGPAYIDPTEAQDFLRRNLAAVGYEITQNNTLADLVKKWKMRGRLNGKEMFELWEPTSEQMNQLTDDLVLPFLPDWVAEIPSNTVTFSLMGDVDYTAVNFPLHTVVDGKPVYESVVKIRETATKTPADYQLLVAHEGRPGHALHVPIMHRLYAEYEYGFETTLKLMVASPMVIAEGIATSTSDILFGNNVKDNISKNELVAMAAADLNYLGRNNVVVKYIHGEKRKGRLIDYLRKDYAFSKKDAEKAVRGWLFHPQMGKLMGIMYLPAYGIGRGMVRNILQEHPREIALPVLYGTQGQVDGITLHARVAEFVKEKNKIQ